MLYFYFCFVIVIFNQHPTNLKGVSHYHYERQFSNIKYIKKNTKMNIVSGSLNFKINIMLRRLYSSYERVPQVCIVGAGPAGFYAAMHINKHLNPVKIDILEKLPVPFGLVRYGVAPDHPEVKNVINQFSKCAQQPNVSFYGNITLGKDISINQLRQHYDAVLLTYGAEEDRTLGIDNEDANNIIAARNFVGWYNGHPRDKNLKVDLSGHTAAILGQGNVALDIARIILSPIDQLKNTDITEYALQALADSKVKELYLVGRRGPLHVAFTIKELREQTKLKNCATSWRENDFKGVAEAVSNLQRPRKRLTELMLKSFSDNEAKEKNNKCFKPIFYRSPKKFVVDSNNKLTGIELICNKMVGESLENQKCVPSENTETLNCSLAVRSIGYKSIKVDSDLVFNDYGYAQNDKGRIVQNENEKLAKLYVSGWLGTGPVGVILHTMGNAFQVAKIICEDLNKTNANTYMGGFEAIKNTLLKNSTIIDWHGWEKIDKYEIEQGKKSGKIREKISSVDKMIEVAIQ